jgi:chromosome partitioning protein
VHKRTTENQHMRTIAITINKGGVGKTMLTKSLATAATTAGLNVVMLDMDTQQNATTWGRRRSKQQDRPLPLARFTTEHDLSEELQRAESAGCDLVLIDTPPGRSSEAPAAVESADLVLIPFWNDQDAYEGVAKTAVLVRRMGKAAFGILNFATPNSRTHVDTARTVLQAIPLPLAPVVLHRYGRQALRRAPLARPRGRLARKASRTVPGRRNAQPRRLSRRRSGGAGCRSR